MAHTPGPWGICPETDGTEIVAYSAPWKIRQLIARPERGENFIANAALIAAAPDMLMALLEVSVFAEMQIEDLAAAIQEGEDATIARMELKRWQSVGDAIRKAAGQQS